MKNPNVSNAISNLYLSEHLSDVNFVIDVDGGVCKISAHKVILAAMSSVFDAMFFGPLKETGDVKIVDATIEVFEEFLTIFYLPAMILSMENAKDVLRLADKYDVTRQLARCLVDIADKLTLDNVWRMYHVSVLMGNEQIKRSCEDIIKTKSHKIFEMVDFCRCDRLVLKQMLQLDSFGCNELDIFNACLKWATSNCKRNGIDDSKPANWRAQLGDCVRLIRFGAIDINEFIQHSVSYRNEFFTPTELVDIMYAKVTKSSQFLNKPRSNVIVSIQIGSITVHCPA